MINGYVENSRWKSNIHEFGEYEGLFDFVKDSLKWARGKIIGQATPKATSYAVSSSVAAEDTSKVMPVLNIGSRGNAVKILQRKLNKLGYNLSVDGIFGRNTRRAVIDFQKKYGLVPDGIVGKKTWTKLFKLTGVPVIKKERKLKPREARIIPPPPPSPTPPPPPAPSPSPFFTRGGEGIQGVLSIIIRNWIWIAIAGASIITIGILLQRR